MFSCQDVVYKKIEDAASLAVASLSLDELKVCVLTCFIKSLQHVFAKYKNITMNVKQLKMLFMYRNTSPLIILF